MELSSKKSQSTTSTTKLQLNERSTQEQLRINHIETLEVLSQTSKENEALKSRVLLLEKKLKEAGLQVDDDDAETAEEPNDTTSSTKELSYTELMLQNRNLSKEIDALKEKMRISAAEEQKRFNEIQTRQLMEFSQQILKSQQKEKELTVQNKMLEEQLSLMQSTNTHMSALQGQVLALREQLEEKSSQCDALQSDVQAITTQLQHQSDLNTQYQTDMAALQTQLAQYIDALNQVKHVQEALESVNAEKNRQIHILQVENESLRKVTTTVEKAIVFGDSDDEREPEDDGEEKNDVKQLETCDAAIQTSVPSSPVPGPAKISPPPAIIPIITAMEPQEEKDDDSIHPQNFRFQDFIRLKRENKELKLRLADLTSTTSTSNILGAAGHLHHNTAASLSTLSSKTATTKSTPILPLGSISSSNGSYKSSPHSAANSGSTTQRGAAQGNAAVKLPQLRRF